VKKFLNENCRNLLLVFILAVTARLVFVVFFRWGFPLSGDEPGYDVLGWNLASIGKYWPNGHYWPPLYPVFLAFVYKIFGHSYNAVRFIQITLGGISCLLIYTVTYLMSGKNKRTALTAGLFAAVYYGLIRWTSALRAENLFVPLYLAATLFFLKLKKEGRQKYLFLGGVFLGLGALTRTMYLFIICPLLVWAFIEYGPTRKMITSYFLICLFFFAAISPKTIWNYVQYNKFILITTQGGAAFLTSKRRYVK